MYRRADPLRGASALEVLLVHPGGPFFARKDAGAWTLPKGLPNEGEPLLDAAVREFEEETSLSARASDYLPLGAVVLASGKRVSAWAFEGDCDPASVRSNTFELEWPPKSGVVRSFPEVDRAGWFDLETARAKLAPAQAPFLERLVAALGERDGRSESSAR